jgi:hypothetical protein
LGQTINGVLNQQIVELKVELPIYSKQKQLIDSISSSMVFNQINKVIQGANFIVKTISSRGIASQSQTTIFLSILISLITLLSLIPIRIFRTTFPISQRNINLEILDASFQELTQIADFVEGVGLVGEVAD